MDINKLEKACLEIVYDLHTQDQSRDYKELCEDIIGDMLMCKYDSNDKLKTLQPRVLQTIRNYHKIAKIFKEKYALEIKGVDASYTVYRGIKNQNCIKSGRIRAMIPFSCSIQEENALNWIGDTCCVLEIRFPMQTEFVCINNPNEGKEVVLPEGILQVQSERKENEINFLSCLFKAY